MRHYRKKPEPPVEAVQWTGENAAEVAEFLGYPSDDWRADLGVLTVSDFYRVVRGDFVVRRPDGMHVNVSAHNFQATYEPVEGATPVEHFRAKQNDCGVCGVEATSLVPVGQGGYAVPRCDDHGKWAPYQAESRLHTILAAQPEPLEEGIYDFSEVEALQAATDEIDILGTPTISQCAEILLTLQGKGWRLVREPVEEGGGEWVPWPHETPPGRCIHWPKTCAQVQLQTPTAFKPCAHCWPGGWNTPSYVCPECGKPLPRGGSCVHPDEAAYYAVPASTQPPSLQAPLSTEEGEESGVELIATERARRRGLWVRSVLRKPLGGGLDWTTSESEREGFPGWPEFAEYWRELYGTYDPTQLVDRIEFELVEGGKEQ
jgi:hypothetical protein